MNATPPSEDFDCSRSADVQRLYKQLSGLAISKTSYVVSDFHMAQDIVQDVFQKMWERHLKFPNIKAAYQWIYTACHNAGIDSIRQHKSRAAVLDAKAAFQFVIPQTADERLVNLELLKVIVNRLNERQAQVLAYLVIDGLLQKDIADLIQVSEKTVQRTVAEISSCLEQFRKDV